MKELFPEEWFPTRKTKGREVVLSEFFSRGPRVRALRGITDEWSFEHVVRTCFWTSGLIEVEAWRWVRISGSGFESGEEPEGGKEGGRWQVERNRVSEWPIEREGGDN